jgi:hypothetical protein
MKAAVVWVFRFFRGFSTASEFRVAAFAVLLAACAPQSEREVCLPVESSQASKCHREPRHSVDNLEVLVN